MNPILSPISSTAMFKVNGDVAFGVSLQRNGALTLTDNSATAINTQGIHVNADTASVWGISVTDQRDGYIALTGDSWGQSLAPWQSLTVGFTGNDRFLTTLNSISFGPATALPLTPSNGVSVGQSQMDHTTTTLTKGTLNFAPHDNSATVQLTASSASELTKLDGSVAFDVSEQWSGAVTITNKSAMTGGSGKLQVTADNIDVARAWGLTVTDISDGNIALAGNSWGQSLAPWQSLTVGFTSNGPPPTTLDIVRLQAEPALDLIAAAPVAIADNANSRNLSAEVAKVASGVSSQSKDSGGDAATRAASSPAAADVTNVARPLMTLDVVPQKTNPTSNPASATKDASTVNLSSTDAAIPPTGELLSDQTEKSSSAVTLTTAPSSMTTSNLDVAFKVSSQWNGGYNGAVTITNNSAAKVDTWVLQVDADNIDIANAWGMTMTDLGNGHIALTGDSWAKSLGPWQSVTTGFTGKGLPPATLEVIPPEKASTADPVTASPFVGTDYADALDLSMDFYDAQYSGDLPDDHPIAWRSDSALTDGADVGRDLSGGWYDAGDHVKFGLPMAYTATTLAWGAIDYADGYKAAGSYDHVVKHIGWATDYLMRAYDDKGTADLSDDIFYVQVGNGKLDHAYWGAAEDMTMARPTYAVTADAPGTEVTAESAAALAAGAILLAEAGQQDRADAMVTQAAQLFAFSETYQGTYNDSVPEAAEFYRSWSGFEDELAWAATWLFEATGDTTYLAKAQTYYQPSGTYWAFGWDDKSMGTAVRLAEFTNDASYRSDVSQHLGQWATKIDRLPGTETNQGLAVLDDWGSNRYAANTAFIAMEFADTLDSAGATAQADAARAFASDQIDYMLGDNPDEFSFLIGFGDTYSQNPHHRGASGTSSSGSPGSNEYTLFGALVGGPDKDGIYEDVRTNYVQNEVALDYNAGLSGALAGLVSHYGSELEF